MGNKIHWEEQIDTLLMNEDVPLNIKKALYGVAKEVFWDLEQHYGTKEAIESFSKEINKLKQQIDNDKEVGG